MPAALAWAMPSTKLLKCLRHEGDHQRPDRCQRRHRHERCAPGQPGWRVAIEPPSGEGTPSRYVLLSNYAITTSGDAFQARSKSMASDIRTSSIPAPDWASPAIAVSPSLRTDCITADSYTKPICVHAGRKPDSKSSKPYRAPPHLSSVKSPAPLPRRKPPRKKKKPCKPAASISFWHRNISRASYNPEKKIAPQNYWRGHEISGAVRSGWCSSNSLN